MELNNNLSAYKKNLVIVYELTMAYISIVSITLLIVQLVYHVDAPTLKLFLEIDDTIIFLFTGDYLIRLLLAKNKRVYFKENLINLIVIVPLPPIFSLLGLEQLSRYTRAIKVIRIYSLYQRFSKAKNVFEQANVFIYVAYITLLLIFFGSIGIYMNEDMSFSDAFWYTIVTITTVGYGDITPKTDMGRFIAIILMMTGIGFLGMLTSTFATYFIKHKDHQELEVKHYTNSIDNIKHSIDNIHHLSDDQLNEVIEEIRIIHRGINK